MYSHFGVLVDGAMSIDEVRKKVSEQTDTTLRKKAEKRKQLHGLLQLRTRTDAQIERLEAELSGIELFGIQDG